MKKYLALAVVLGLANTSFVFAAQESEPKSCTATGTRATSLKDDDSKDDPKDKPVVEADRPV